MAHATCSKESGFKCGKCRTTILIDNDGQMLLLDPANVENLDLKSQQTGADATLWHLQTDGLPDWVTDAINQSSWTKGKLHCPTCQTKVGSFDFVGDKSQSSPVHLVKSKVDPYGQRLIKQKRTNQPLRTRLNDETSIRSIQRQESSSGASVTNVPSYGLDSADLEDISESNGECR